MAKYLHAQVANHPVGKRAHSIPSALVMSSSDRPNMGGLAILLTGLPGAGKTTLAQELAQRLEANGTQATLLDGDRLREQVSPTLGFSPSDRAVNLRHAAFIAAEIVRHGGMAVCSFIAPFEKNRLEFRQSIERVGSFALVYVSTPFDVCEKRDPKGMYEQARKGLIQNFTGVSDRYEEPSRYEAKIDTADLSINDAVDCVIQQLARRTLRASLWKTYGSPSEMASSVCGEGSSNEHQARQFQTILDMLSTDRTSMLDISSTLGMERRAIERLVRSVTGNTFRELQQAVLSERARSLLDAGKSIKEVAFSLGFGSPQTFHRFFVRTVGRTPAIYRTEV